jgi:hypothetical protein
MIHQGTAASRLEVAGFADQRPIASNATAAGKQQNRRVEVLILPTTVHNSVPSMATTTTPRRSAPKKEFNKDTFNKETTAGTGAERGPAYNK